MKQPFSTETPDYHADAPLTSYQRAKQEWDDRIGGARVQAKNWRFMALLSMIVSLILLVMLIISLSLDHTVVYVAQVGPGGRVVNVAPLEKSYTPTSAEKEYFLGQFIQLIRSIPLDPVVAKRNWVSAYQFLSARGAQQLNTIMRENNPLKVLGDKTVTVNISDINPISENSYHVDWTEKTIDSSGKLDSTISYSGTFTIMVQPPKTQTAILQNPLGIYIVDFHISTREN